MAREEAAFSRQHSAFSDNQNQNHHENQQQNQRPFTAEGAEDAKEVGQTYAKLGCGGMCREGVGRDRDSGESGNQDIGNRDIGNQEIGTSGNRRSGRSGDQNVQDRNSGDRDTLDQEAEKWQHRNNLEIEAVEIGERTALLRLTY